MYVKKMLKTTTKTVLKKVFKKKKKKKRTNQHEDTTPQIVGRVGKPVLRGQSGKLVKVTWVCSIVNSVLRRQRRQ